MKKFRYILLLALTLLLNIPPSHAQTLLDGKKWSKYSMSTSGVTNLTGNLQGAAYYNGKIYSFRQVTNVSPTKNTYNIYDIATNKWAPGKEITCAPGTHMGSACFAPSVVSSYTKGGTTYSCTIPFVLVSAHGTLQGDGTAASTRTIYCAVIDIENDQLIRVVRFKDRKDDAIMAYDFAGNRFFVFGYAYTQVEGKAPYMVNQYSVNFADILSTDNIGNTIDYSSETPVNVSGIGGPTNGIQETLQCGTVQDIFYNNNRLYVCTGRGSLYNRTEFNRAFCYNISTQAIEDVKMSTDYKEAQGLVYDGTNIWMLTSSSLWKLASGTQYDAYNFKQPTETTTGTYSITNASELCWFLQQVYGGRTTISAVLANDIDLTGVTLPNSFYVYDSTNKFDAQYAFRGTFDGDGHKITGLNITNTPYYNDGLFPYVIGGTIKDVTVEGNIKLTTCTTSAGDKQPVANVGLIGYMDGGTLENVNAFITIDQTVAGVSGTINKLVGTYVNGTEITNCLTEDPSKVSHEQNGGNHYYVNGFCVCTDAAKTNAGYYEAPELITAERCTALGISQDYYTNGYYEVKNAGNMFWIAKNFSSSNYNRKYVMTADIDMEGNVALHQDWAGIGDYNNNTSTSHFCGTFDGNGHKFTNFYMKVSSGNWKAMFNLTNAGAVIKNFSIDGQVDITDSKSQIGAVVGRVQGTTTLEDIHSSVNFTVATGKTASAIGGIVGQCSAQTTLNRCRYSGTITGNSSFNGLGGIVGNAEGILTFNNCLFDGTISTTATQARTGVDDGLKIGGICGRNNNKTTITNSMSRGTISVPSTADKGNVGVIMGTQTNNNKLTITNTYYTAISGINAVGNNSNTDKSSANPTAITNETPLSLRIALGQENWKFVDTITEYPVPGIGGPILQVVTITFETNGGSAITPISGVEGTEIATAPADPTKEGHDFAGWVDAQGNATTIPTVMPSQDLTIYASWKVNKYTITFNTDGGSTIEPITQDYGTAITKPANPTKDGWDFGGWEPAVPSTMPAGNLTVVAQWTREEYNNGFNVNASCAANVKYQLPAGSGTAEDPYLIDNGGKLWWFANQVKTDKTLCARLTDNINTECNTRVTNTSTNLPQMGAWGAPYKGTFDGRGYRVYNWKQIWTTDSRGGLFGYTENATIKDFTLEGSMTVSVQQQHASVVGYAGAGTLVEDIWSKVDIAANSTVFAVGGVVGRQNGTLNRCRYSGTITCATSVYKGIGGVVGETYGGLTNNCLFDGTIIAPSSDPTLRVGGIVGYQSEASASTVKNCFVNGTITTTNYSTATSGVVMGGNTNQIYVYNMYYTRTNVSENLNRAAGIETKSAMGHCEDVTDKACVTNGTLCDLLGNGNWTQDSELGYPVPHKGTATEGYDANGFSYAKDGQHDAVTLNGEWYEIANGGQLLDYAQKIAAGTIAGNSKARLTKDVDLEWCDFPGIGVYNGSNKRFSGTFDGQGYTVRGMYRNLLGTAAQGQGMFNHADNATIKDLNVEGEIQIHEGGSSTYFIGGIVGLGTTKVTLEDITSSVDINVIKGSAETRIIGGIAGRVVGTLNRCRYNGTMDLGTIVGQQIGGVLASSNNTTISNCLYDGTILAATSNTTDTKVVIGGLLGIDNEKATISNCLSNGTITLSSASAPTTKVGSVWGQIQKTTSSSTVTYYTTTNITSAGAALDQAGGANVSSNMQTTAVGETSWADVNKALNNGTTSSGDWKILTGQEYPIPYYFTHVHEYNKYGYCTICEHAEDLEQDADGNYIIKHLAGLGEFRNLVNSSPKGTILNAKVTADIDVTDVPVRWGKNLIGDHAHPYCGTFDGQGYSFKGLDVTFDEDQRYVGVFECVGIKDSDASKAKAGIIKNFSVSGKLTATYFSNWNSNTPLCMGVIGEIYNGMVENVHSSVDFYCTSGVRAHIGGVVGGSLHSSTDAGEIVIKNCSYTGTINVNASDNIGGIVGYAQHDTHISNTLYAGKIIQNWTRNANEEDGGSGDAQGPISTYIGGVLGYCNSVSNGVQNSIILGEMNSNLTDFLTDKMTRHKNNMNICVGFDGSIASSYTNYHGNYITPEMKTKYHQLPSNLFSGTAKIYTETEFATGIVCAKLNADPSAENDPWGQILGYQVGPNKDPDSPAQPYPFPGYTDPEQTSYKVVQKLNEEKSTETDKKYDYTADYYFFDDYGDTTPFPSDAASMKVKRIDYTRRAKYMIGYCSVCLPYELTSDRIPSGAKIYTYNSTDWDNRTVIFNEVSSVNAGTPCIIFDNSEKAWINFETSEVGIPLALNATNATDAGLYGSFDTMLTEVGYYKVQEDGETLAKTTETSHCYPYRAYLKLADNTGKPVSAKMSLVWGNNYGLPDNIEFVNADGTSTSITRYNLAGQPVRDSAKGIVIVNGKKYIKK